MHAFVVDAYDSFVYIICQYLSELDVDVTVRRNDVTTPEVIESASPDFIVLGPGPGHPANCGYVEIIEQLSANTPTLGICLGHQAIGLAFGGTIDRAQNLKHGKTSLMHHDGKGCFKGQPEPLRATRYHSLIVERSTVPNELVVTATSEDDGYVMGMRHRDAPIESVQFHPESVLTQNGLQLFANFIKVYVR